MAPYAVRTDFAAGSTPTTSALRCSSTLFCAKYAASRSTTLSGRERPDTMYGRIVGEYGSRRIARQHGDAAVLVLQADRRHRFQCRVAAADDEVFAIGMTPPQSFSLSHTGPSGRSPAIA